MAEIYIMPEPKSKLANDLTYIQNMISLPQDVMWKIPRENYIKTGIVKNSKSALELVEFIEKTRKEHSEHFGLPE